MMMPIATILSLIPLFHFSLDYQAFNYSMSMVNECVDFYSEVLYGVRSVPNHLDSVLWHLSDEIIYGLERQIVPLLFWSSR
jgi:hypothetical protein